MTAANNFFITREPFDDDLLDRGTANFHLVNLDYIIGGIFHAGDEPSLTLRFVDGGVQSFRGGDAIALLRKMGLNPPTPYEPAPEFQLRRQDLN